MKFATAGAILAAATTTFAAFGANAALETSSHAAYIPFATDNYFGTGPVTVAPGVTWTSTNAFNQGGAVYGYDGGYGFGVNGYDFETLAGINDSSDVYGVVDSMTFSFATPVSSVGGFINWVPNALPVTIAAYDASNNLLESFTLSAGDVNLVTPNSFYGFLDGTADISSFVLTDGYVGVMSGLNGGTITGGGVPEPATWALMLVGVAGLGAGLRARRRTSASAA